jgi:hypothetical protein
MKQTGHEEAARQYLDRVIAVQKRHGLRPNLPAEEYERAVKDTARVFERLSTAVDSTLSEQPPVSGARD